MRPLLVVGIVATLAVHALSAQSPTPPKPAFATEMMTSDSLSFDDARASNDGRWLLFSSAVRSGPAHLWVVPVSGGPPHRLTDGPYDEVFASWFPSSRRIAFTSTNLHAVMTAEFDPVSGRLIGTPKRASLEEGSWVDVSPDGKQIAYLDPKNRIRIIPANGGPARTILDQSGAGRPGLGFMRFSADGNDVYVTTMDQDHIKPGTLLRVPTGGGTAAVVLTGTSDNLPWSIAANPKWDRVLSYGRQGTTVLTLRGDTIAVMPPLRGYRAVEFTSDGRRVLKSTSIGTAVVRLVPTMGGKVIDATPGTGYDWPVSWSADGKILYSNLGDSTLSRGKPGVLAATVSSGERRFIPLVPSDSTLAARKWKSVLSLGDGRHWALIEGKPQPPFALLIFDSQTREAREVTRNLVRVATAPGGYLTGGTELLFIEQQGAQHQLRAMRADGVSRVLHTFPRLNVPWVVAVHGDRFAYGERIGDSTVLRVTKQSGAEQQLAAMAGNVAELAWSPDGHTLAALINPSKSNEHGNYSVMFMNVSEQGVRTGGARVVRVDASWDLTWLADNRAVTVLEEQGATAHTRVLRVPVDPNQPPTSLTPNERATFWDQYPSPDGRYVAIPVERAGKSTLWSIDFDAAAKAWREKKGKIPPRPGAQ